MITDVLTDVALVITHAAKADLQAQTFEGAAKRSLNYKLRSEPLPEWFSKVYLEAYGWFSRFNSTYARSSTDNVDCQRPKIGLSFFLSSNLGLGLETKLHKVPISLEQLTSKTFLGLFQSFEGFFLKKKGFNRECIYKENKIYIYIANIILAKSN